MTVPTNLGSLYAERLESSVWTYSLRPAYNFMGFYLSDSFLNPGINERLIFTGFSYWYVGKNQQSS